MITSAIAPARIGGTAFPTCFICEPLFPINTKSSGKDCILAASRTVIALSKNGCVNLGLRFSTKTRKYKKKSEKKISLESDFDKKLLDNIDAKIRKKPTETPTYQGKPKKKPPKVSSSKAYPRDTNTALNALAIADYKCEVDPKHPTFIRKKNNLPYTEPHHLIPMAYSDNFDLSLDVEENIVSLCSHCHNQIHYGKDIEIILQPLYEQRKDMLARVGLYIKYAELLKMYK